MKVTVVRNTAGPHFRKMSRRSKNMRPVLKVIMKWVRKVWREAFDKKRDPLGGGKWARRKQSQSWPLMLKSRRLVNSLLTSISRLSGKARATAPYAGYHHRGTRNMPRRRALGIPSALRQQISKAMKRYIVDGVVTK
jgi:phage gpG-like protein